MKLRYKRNWAELNSDILTEIFRMVGTLSVLLSAGSVCRAWRKVAKDEPELWRRIHITGHREQSKIVKRYLTRFGIGWVSCLHMERIKSNLCKIAIDRSGGKVEEFWIEHFGDDRLLRYLGERTSGLKSLRLLESIDVSDKAIVELAKRQPLIEELELKFVMYRKDFPELLGKALPNLKQLILDRIHVCEREMEFNNTVAVGIGSSMPQLRNLLLAGHTMSYKGLKAILKGCPHLETLKVRMGYNFQMDSETRALCAGLAFTNYHR